VARKPPLTVVAPDATGSQPPRPLGAHGKALWRNVQAEYSITDVGGIELLAHVCAALDRAEALREQIEADGEVLRTARGQIRDHPGLKHELAARSFVCRTLQRLGLNIEPVKSPGRPAGGFGWRGE
jgi:P27 family predicted phage terminase small subunit